jgi:DNA repair protein RecN (Recombination protein N)
MLRALHIRNVVLIDQLTLEFNAGLAALTGETGAGKSILLDSLGLALGMRAESGLVRAGADQATVSAEFDLPKDHPAQSILKEQGITTGEDLILRRVLGADGRSRAFVNDQPVSVGLLKSLGDVLVDIHGQFETYGLLNPQTHRQVLDDYADAGQHGAAVASAYAAWQDAEKKLAQARKDAEKAAANESWLRAVVEELETLDPQPGEEDHLLSLRQKIQNRDAVLQALDGAAQLLDGEDSAEARIGQAWKFLHRAQEKIGSDVQPVLETLDRAAATLQDAHRQIGALLAGFDAPEHNLETLEDRLYELRGQARKHQCRVDDLAAKREELGAQLKLIDHQDHVLADLEKQVKSVRDSYQAEAKKLHDLRMKAAQKLDKQVNKELGPLKLNKAVFMTSMETLPESQWNSTGMDDIRFLVSTNPGAAPGPLNKIASGGEMARFMLALKVVLAEAAHLSGVYVFDEIDTGIGGATASAVGERLARLADRHQVLVVTHSPQVAARAGHHWVVSKTNASTKVIPLKARDRQEEIARMLSGASITEEARAAAGKLLEASAA